MNDRNNVKIRRSIRKFTMRYGVQDTRKITRVFAAAWGTPRQCIAGNLRALKYCDHTIAIKTLIPGIESVMNSV